MDNAPRYLLFSGAGLTANVGGYLARRIWECIYNSEDIKKRENIIKLLYDESNFETAYKTIQSRENFSIEDRKEFRRVIENTFETMDSEIVAQTHKTYLHRFMRFIDFFKKDQRFYFFTINQDIFIERIIFGVAGGIRPGIYPKNNTPQQYIPFAEREKCKVPSKEEIIEKERTYLGSRNYFYIKLHGSMDWIRSDGSGAMVFGGEKEKQIGNEPILDWNYDLFEEVLSQSQKILIFGYGFKDEHINNALYNAASNHNLEIYIFDKRIFEEIKTDLQVAFKGNNNLLYRIRYYSDVQNDLFSSQAATMKIRQFANDFFGKGGYNNLDFT